MSPTHKHRCHTGNGLAFQFFFCCAVLLVGILVGVYRGFPSTPPLAMLGGALWCTGNVLSVPCIKLCGMGLAILIWGISNMLLGWASGTFGLFGLDKQGASNEPLNYAGVAVALLSLLVYLFVKVEDHHFTPTAAAAGAGASTAAKDGVGAGFGAAFHSSLLMEEGGASSSAGAAGAAAAGSAALNIDRHGADVFLPGLTGTKRFLLGAALALLAGCFYGCSFNAAYYIMDHAKQAGSVYAPYGGLELMDFVFPHFTGVFLAASAYFLLCLLASHLCGNGNGSRNRRARGGRKSPPAFAAPPGPEVYPAAILPAFASGGLWAVAMCAWFVANEHLSMTVTFPIITSTPGLVASLWGVLVFKEIKGKRNLLVLAGAFCLTLTACLLIGFSM